MKGGEITSPQMTRFNSIASNKNVNSQNIQVYVCSSSSIAIQLEMIRNRHKNALGRLNSRNINPENNLIYMGVLKKLKERRDRNQYDITTMLDGQEKNLFLTNKKNFYANFAHGNNILIIDMANPTSVSHEVKWAIRDLFRQLGFNNGI